MQAAPRALRGQNLLYVADPREGQCRCAYVSTRQVGGSVLQRDAGGQSASNWRATFLSRITKVQRFSSLNVVCSALR